MRRLWEKVQEQGTYIPDPDNLGKLKPTKRAYGSVKKQKLG